ncbi:MAG TPA: methyltransferase domain-containing protein [Chitinophagaceae bacterium]|jgi:ubiquinone/menaquinone biosynthesis C-methylase UbiE|nr:methyltransferase domain-containing protein [Chitinophagaceae bacterium]
MKTITDSWDSGDPYEYFMGRWSKLMAPVFLKWLSIPYGQSWLDVGCGTGSLSEAIFQNYKPSKLACIDTSAEFLAKAKGRLSYEVDFCVGSASNIPKGDDEFDVVVSGLALNFFPDLTIALSEMKRVLRVNGTIAAYVWDYAGRMDFLRFFWDAAVEIDPDSHKFDEGVRFPICNTENLKTEFKKAGLIDIETSYLNIKTIFKTSTTFGILFWADKDLQALIWFL